MKKVSVKINGATPKDRSLIIGNALQKGLTISKYVRDTVSDFILNCEPSDVINLLGNQTDRSSDVPKCEIKISPSKIEFTVERKVYDKLSYLANKLKVSKSIILYKVFLSQI